MAWCTYWTATDGPAATLEGHSRAVNAVAFSSGGAYRLALANDDTTRL